MSNLNVSEEVIVGPLGHETWCIIHYYTITAITAACNSQSLTIFGWIAAN